MPYPSDILRVRSWTWSCQIQLPSLPIALPWPMPRQDIFQFSHNLQHCLSVEYSQERSYCTPRILDRTNPPFPLAKKTLYHLNPSFVQAAAQHNQTRFPDLFL